MATTSVVTMRMSEFSLLPSSPQPPSEGMLFSNGESPPEDDEEGEEEGGGEGEAEEEEEEGEVRVETSWSRRDTHTHRCSSPSVGWNAHVSPSSTPLWFGLPLELQLEIWLFLPPREIFKQSLVCCNWRDCWREDVFWREAHNRFPSLSCFLIALIFFVLGFY